MKALVIINPSLHERIRPKLNNKNQIYLKEPVISINNYCKTALLEAIKFKNKGSIKNILVATIGDLFYQKYLDYALNIGSDESLLILNKQNIEYSPLNIAKIYRSIIQKEKIKIVFIGSCDENTSYNQIAPILASITNYNLAYNIHKIEMSCKKILAESNIDEQIITLAIKFPVIASFKNYLKREDIILTKKKSK